MIEREKISILSQYINALKDASEKLEETYNQKNAEGLKKVKIFILEVQSKINLLLK